MNTSNKELIIKFLDDLTMNRGRAQKTRISYDSDLDLFIRYISKELLQCDKQDLLSYKYYLVKQGLSPATINRKFSTIKSFYLYLQKEEILEKNPSLGIEKLKLPKKIPIVMNTTQATLLLDGILMKGRYSTRDYAIFSTFLLAGCRVSEIVNLNVGDVDFDNDLLYIRNAKGSKDRAIPILPNLKEGLKSYLNQGMVYEKKKIKLKTKEKEKTVIAKHKCGRGYFLNEPEEEAFFLTKSGTRFSSKGIEYLFKQYLKMLGIYKKGLSLHALRRSCFTFLFNQGADVFTLKEISGHSRVQTLEHYLSIDASKMRTVMQLHPLINKGIDSRLVELIRT